MKFRKKGPDNPLPTTAPALSPERQHQLAQAQRILGFYLTRFPSDEAFEAAIREYGADPDPIIRRVPYDSEVRTLTLMLTQTQPHLTPEQIGTAATQAARISIQEAGGYVPPDEEDQDNAEKAAAIAGRFRFPTRELLSSSRTFDIPQRDLTALTRDLTPSERTFDITPRDLTPPNVPPPPQQS